MLRTLTPEYATEEYASWLNDSEVNEYLSTRSATVPELCAFIQEKFESDDALFFGIFWNENGKHIGNMKLEPIDFTKSSADLGMLIGDRDYWGKGVATEATNLITAFAFDILKLTSVRLGVIPENTVAVHVYEKCGFVKYETEKDALFEHGRFVDRMWMRKNAP